MSLSSDFWNALDEKKKKELLTTGKTTSKTNIKTTDTNIPVKTRNANKGTSASLNSDFWANVDEDMIAPVRDRVNSRTTVKTKKKDEDEEKWYQGWFQKGAFEDGVSLKNTAKAILGTMDDALEDLGTGIIGMGEKAVDALATIAPYFEQAQFVQNGGYYNIQAQQMHDQALEESKKEISKFVAKDLYDEAEISKKIVSGLNGGFNYETNSVFGEKTDSIVQSGGQLLGTAALQAVGVPWFLTTGATAFGGEAEQAFNEGATNEEAVLSSTISAGAEILTEKISGGIKFGGKTLDDALTQQIARGISDKFLRKAAKLGLDMFGEGAEEWITEDLNKFGQWLTYRDEEELKELLFSEEAMDDKIEAFIGGAALGGVSNVSNAVKSKIDGVDSVTGLTKSEESVARKVYDKLVAERSKKGNVSAKEKQKLYDSVIRELDKGGISTDIIESILDEEGYNAYKAEKDNFFKKTKKTYNDAIASEESQLKELQKKLDELADAPNTVGNNRLYDSIVSQMNELKNNPKSATMKAQLDQEVKRINELHNQLRTKVHDMVKGTKLEESYNELIRSQQKYEVDTSKYTDPNAKKTIENILKSGMGDNSNHFHEYADWLAQISADKGMAFSLTNDKALKGTEHDFSAEGKRANGFVTEDGIVLNMDSPKALNSTVGHEVTHVLEQNTELYKALQESVFNYAIAKEGLDSFNARLKAIEKMYKGKNANAEAELTADLIGDYLFTDYDFVHNLSVENRNLFEKIYDEIKYLCKVVTAGSKEARELEKVKKAFEDAYRANVKGKPDAKTQRSLSEEYSDMVDSDGVVLTQAQKRYFGDTGLKDDSGNLLKLYRSADGGRTVWDGRGEGSSAKGIYLTDDVYVARAFAVDGKKVGDVLEVYAKADNPLVIDAQGSSYIDIPMPEDAPAWLEDSGDWEGRLNADQLPIDAFANGHDAVIIKNVREGVGGDPATDVILRDSNQMKRTDNTNPTADKDIRFSLSDAVEETKDLMALHNLHSSELLKQLKMGGMAYPSIAITKPGILSHDNFGEVSLILHKDSIDPKKSKYNKVYSADAYTPTFPSVDYEASEQVVANITSKVNALYDNLPEYYQRSLRSLRDYANIDDQLNRWGGEQRLVEKYADDYAMKQLYLAEKGEAVPVGKKYTETRMTDYQMKLYQTVADTIGEDVLKSFNEKGSFEKLGMARMAWLEKYGGALKDIYAADWSSDGTMTKEEAMEIANEQKPIYWKGEIDRALDFIKTGGVTVTETDDIGSTQAKIDEKIAGSDYKQWVNNLFSGIEGQSGIRNSKDLFTPSGNRRSFAQTHDPLTIDNIVKAMRKENQTGQGAFGGGSILGASAKEFGSIAEIKRNSGKLGTMDKAEHDAITDKINDTFWDIARRYANGKDIIDAQEAIAEAVSKNESKAGIARYLKQYDYVYQYTDSIGDEIIELRDYIRSLPTPYFEAKPRRGVGFDEVAAFVIPYDADVKLKQELLNRGYNIAEYDPKVEGDRQRVVNQFEEFKFSLADAGDIQKQYGDWNVYGSDFGYKGDFAPVIPTPNRTSVLPGERHSVAEMFPDEPDIEQAEYDNLVEAKNALENRLQELSASADFNDPEVVSEFEKLTAEWSEASTRLLELDAELSNTDRLDSLTDADAPPEMDAPYYESDPTTLTKKATADIVRDVRASLGLTNPEMADCKDIIERYRTGEIQSREELIEALQDKFGTFKDTEVDERLAEVKRAIRTTRINVSDTIKHGIADYAHVMRSNRGKILFAKNGLAVDEVYKELQEQFPDFFNEDVDMNPEDQLRHIIEIANTPHIDEVQREKDIGNIEEAADLIINGIGKFKYNEKLNLSNRESKQAFESLVRQGDKYAPMDDIAPVAKNATTTKATVSKTESVAPAKPQQNGRVAQVHTVEPKTEKKKSKAWSWAKEHLLDNGMVFEDLSKKTGNRKLEAKWNFIRNSGARAQRLIGKGANGVKSLTDIRKQVEKSGKTDKFYNYLYHVHNIDRMTLADRFTGTPNKAVFGDTVTADISKQEAARLLKQNPEFKQWAQDVYKFNKHLRKLLVDGGVISQETADLWEKMYPHYVPIRREGDNGLNINVPLDSNKTGINAPVKKATGGSRDILPLFDTMAMRAEQTYRAIAKNNFGIELKNMLGSTISNEAQTVDGVIESLESDEALLKPGVNGIAPTFTVFENGERVEFEITDEMYEAMKPASGITSTTSKVLNGISNFRRGTLTEYNPWFLLKNAIKDQQDIIINSQHPIKTYANIFPAIGEMIGKGKYYQEYLENGGEQNTYFDDESGFEKNKAWEAVKWATGLNEIAWANNKIEMLPRLAEYMASRKDGRSVEVSMLDAARVTTNFAAGGDVTKWANRNGVTFLNASVQGAVQQARNIREAKMNGLKGWAGLAAKYLVAGLPVVLLNNLIWEDDEEYEELADYVKRDYYIVGRFGDGKFVRIPKGRTVAVLQNAFEQMDNLRTGDDEVDLKAFLDLAVSNLAPNNPLDNNVISPITQVLQNKTWYGEDLVPSRLQNVPKEEQYDESTDDISRWLGEKTGTSPMKWNYLLDQYSGVLGDTFLPMLTPEAESGDDTTLGTMTAPLRDMFTTDSVINNQIAGDFYDTKDLIDIAANSSKATDKDKMKSTYMQAVSWELSDLYKEKRNIQNSNMADSAKYKQSRDIQKQINEIMKNAMGGYENVSIDGLYSEVGNKRFNHDAESGKWYEIKPKNADGAANWYYQMEQNVTKALGISYGEYWNNREEYNYAYEKPEKYTLSKAVGGYESYRRYTSDLYDIKADKDKNGKSISGSRKTKVVEYINNMDADYGEKIILFKTEYPADDTYNHDIIEYLNGRDDISYQEMETILKELGFNVDSKGNVTW